MVKPSTSVRQLKKSNLHLPASEQFHNPGWQAKSMESIQCTTGNPTSEEEEGGYNSSSLSRLEAKALSSWQPSKKSLADRSGPLTRSEGTLTMDTSIHVTQRPVPAPRSSTNLSDSHGPVSTRRSKGHPSQPAQQSGSCKTLSQMKHSSSAWSLSKTLAFCKQRLSKSAERLISTSSHSNHSAKTATNFSSSNLDKEERENSHTTPPPTYHSSVYRLMKKITEKRKGQKCAVESQQDVIKCVDTNATLKYDQRTTLSVLASLTSPPPSASLLDSVYAHGSQSSNFPPYSKSNQSGNGSRQHHQPLQTSHNDSLSCEGTADDPRTQLKVQLWLAGGDSSGSNSSSPNKRASAYSQRNSGMAASPTSPTVILRSISQQCYSCAPPAVNSEALSSNYKASNSRNSSSTTYGNIPSSTALSLNGSASNPSFTGALCITDETIDDPTKLSRGTRFGLSDKYSPQHPYPPMPSPGVEIQCSPNSAVPMGLTEDAAGIISSSGNSSSLSSLNTSTGAFVPASARLSRDSAICLSQAVNSAQVSSQSDSSCMSLLTSCASPQSQAAGNPLDAFNLNTSAMTTSIIRTSGDDTLLYGQGVPISRGHTRSTFSCMPVAHKQSASMLQTPRPPPPPYFRHSGGSGSPKSGQNGKMELSPTDLKTIGLLNTSLHSPLGTIGSKDLFTDQHVSQFRHSLLFPDRTDLIPVNIPSKESPPASPAAPFVRGNYVAPPSHIRDYSNWRQHLPYKLGEHEVLSHLPRHSTCSAANQQASALHPLRRSLEARNERKRSSLMEFQMTESELLTHSQHQKLPLPKALSNKAHSKHNIHDFNIPSGANQASRLFPVPSSSSSLSSSSPPSVLDEEKSRQILAEAANLAGLDYNAHFPAHI